MTRQLTMSTAIILTVLNSFAQSATSFIKAAHYKTAIFNVAIFPGNYAEMTLGKRFTPTTQEIDKAEVILLKDLQKLNKQSENQFLTTVIYKNLDNYKRQYFGYIDKNGNRILLINCFWSKDDAFLNDWLIHRITMLDGGSYFWNIKFNINKGKLFDLYVDENG